MHTLPLAPLYPLQLGWPLLVPQISFCLGYQVHRKRQYLHSAQAWGSFTDVPLAAGEKSSRGSPGSGALQAAWDSWFACSSLSPGDVDLTLDVGMTMASRPLEGQGEACVSGGRKTRAVPSLCPEQCPSTPGGGYSSPADWRLRASEVPAGTCDPAVPSLLAPDAREAPWQCLH